MHDLSRVMSLNRCMELTFAWREKPLIQPSPVTFSTVFIKNEIRILGLGENVEHFLLHSSNDPTILNF